VLGTRKTGRRLLDDGVNDDERKQPRLSGKKEEENRMMTTPDGTTIGRPMADRREAARSSTGAAEADI
jgi:hypothetical protein